MFENTTDSEYTFGEAYDLYVQKNNNWEPIEPIIENWAFHDIGYPILPRAKTGVTAVDWNWLFGVLPNGHYKFQKQILLVCSPGDFHAYFSEQEFSIP